MGNDSMAGLSAEERAALAEDDTPEDLAELKKVAAELENADDDDEDTPAEPAKKEAATPPEEPPAEPVEDEEGEDEDGPVVYAHELVEGYDEKVAEFKSKLDELKRQYKEGDLSFDEYEDQREAMAAERDTLVRQQEKALDERKEKEVDAKAEWERQAAKFLKANKAYEDEILYDALNGAIRRLAEKPEHATKSASWFLKTAHTEVQKRFGRTAETDDAPETPEQKKAAAVAKRRAAAKPAPVTLGEVPAAADASGDSGEFADLDGLAGMELEQALARMPVDKAERYLRGA